MQLDQLTNPKLQKLGAFTARKTRDREDVFFSSPGKACQVSHPISSSVSQRTFFETSLCDFIRPQGDTADVSTPFQSQLAQYLYSPGSGRWCEAAVLHSAEQSFGRPVAHRVCCNPLKYWDRCTHHFWIPLCLKSKPEYKKSNILTNCDLENFKPHKVLETKL